MGMSSTSTDKGVKYKQNKNRTKRSMKSPCVSKLCSESTERMCNQISLEERKKVFDYFWTELDWKAKQVYIANLIDIKVHDSDSRKKCSFIYHFEIEGKRLRVCKTMFLHTFDLTDTRVYGWKLKIAKKVSKTQQKQEQKVTRKCQIVRQFLEKLPKMPSHYCRRSTNKMYLQPDIGSISVLYKLFQDYLKENNCETIGKSILSREFRRQNIAFFQPKKDQCDRCISYESGHVTEDDHYYHIQRKECARQEKQRDKDDPDATHVVLTMDVQAVLTVPRLNASALYYKTKLACHNFTFYDVKSKDVTCYFWHEGEGDLSSNSFVSCVRDYICDIEAQIPTLTKITIYSDGCGYQNRNVTLANVLLDLAFNLDIIIEQKYLERGHTQMEVDSIHSVIERKLKHRSIYHPQQYVDIFKECRPEAPFKVKEVNHEFFKNCSGVKYIDSVRPGRRVGEPQVHELRALKYSRVGNAPKIEYKLDFTEEYEPLPCRVKMPYNPYEMRQLHKASLPIKKTKFDHLQQMKEVMPQHYHAFYDSLKH